MNGVKVTLYSGYINSLKAFTMVKCRMKRSREKAILKIKTDAYTMEIMIKEKRLVRVSTLTQKGKSITVSFKEDIE